MRITPLDAVIVVGYFIATVALGLWFGRKRIATDEQLFLADRKATWPFIGSSLFCANISSQQFVGQAGLAYSIGLAAGAFQLVGAMCFVFLAVFFVDVYLGLRLSTSPEFFERRYNTTCRVLVSGINIVMILAANIMAALYAGATVMNDLLGWHGPTALMLGIVALAVSAGAYTIFGGLRSVLLLDLVQASVLVAGGAIVFWICLVRLGGPAAALAVYEPGGRSMWSVIQPWNRQFGWLPMATGAFILGTHAHCTDQDYVQRALAGRNVYHAKMGAIFAAALKVLALFVIAAPGVMAVRLLPGMSDPDQVYSRLLADFLPPGLSGIVLAGLLSAILGSVAAGLSAASSLVSFDFVQRLRPGLSERARVFCGRGIMVAVLVLCSFGAPAIASFKGLYDYLVLLWSLLAPPVFVCAIFGIFSRRATARGAVATLIAGAVLGAAAFAVLNDPAGRAWLPRYFRSALNMGFVITLVCAGVMVAFSGNRTPGAGGDEGRPARTVFAPSVMTGRERKIYRTCLCALLAFWLVVLAAFSPWGLARSRRDASPAGVVTLRIKSSLER